MCGRYSLGVPLEILLEVFEVPPPHFDYRPRYNVAPSQEAPVAVWKPEGRRLDLMRWGLVPPWARDSAGGTRLINARAETVSRKPAFRDAFLRRRCLVPADGYFEWRKEEDPAGRSSWKTPFWIHQEGREPMAFAGLWGLWGEGKDPPSAAFAILTTEATSAVRDLHPRMPLILPREAWEKWLEPDTPAAVLLPLLVPHPGPDLRAFPVLPLVNSPRNDSPLLVEPAGGPMRSAE